MPSPLSWLDIDTHNALLDQAEQHIQLPKLDEIQLTDPDVYMSRLSEIASPTQQMKEFTLSVFNIFEKNPTHEGVFTRTIALTALGVGWLVGGIIDGQHMTQEYIRKHNASVFDSNYRGRRHKWDTFVLGMARRGMRTGVRASLLCLGAGFISFSTVTYRGKLHYPDWALGFASLGALSRAWLGMRGLVAGAGFGLLGGTIGYATVRAGELASGKSVAEYRYLEHAMLVRKREALREHYQRQRQNWVKDKFLGRD